VGRRAKIVRRKVINGRYHVALVKNASFYVGRQLALEKHAWNRLVNWVQDKWRLQGENRSRGEVEEALRKEGFHLVQRSPEEIWQWWQSREPCSASALPAHIRRLRQNEATKAAAEWLIEAIEQITCRASENVDLASILENLELAYDFTISAQVELPRKAKPRLRFFSMPKALESPDFDVAVEVAIAVDSLLEWINAGCSPALAVCSSCNLPFFRGRGRRSLCDECRSGKLVGRRS